MTESPIFLGQGQQGRFTGTNIKLNMFQWKRHVKPHYNDFSVLTISQKYFAFSLDS